MKVSRKFAPHGSHSHEIKNMNHVEISTMNTTTVDGVAMVVLNISKHEEESFVNLRMNVDEATKLIVKLTAAVNNAQRTV